MLIVDDDGGDGDYNDYDNSATHQVKRGECKIALQVIWWIIIKDGDDFDDDVDDGDDFDDDVDDDDDGDYDDFDILPHTKSRGENARLLCK